MEVKGIKSFRRWNFQFAINGETTLDAVKDEKLLKRIDGRRKLFMQPLMDSDFLRGKSVLDVGCNSGYWSMLALEGGAAFVQGIEAMPELVEQAHWVFERYGVDAASYGFEVADAYDFLAHTERKFDVILCLGFFYHINDPVRLLQLMANACTGFVIIDTLVHNAVEALVSVRPVTKKGRDDMVESANIGLELVSSPKAIHWMAREAGFRDVRSLTSDYEKVSSMWDYIKGERRAFVLSHGPTIGKVFANVTSEAYLTPEKDLAEYGYYPEMRGVERKA